MPTPPPHPRRRNMRTRSFRLRSFSVLVSIALFVFALASSMSLAQRNDSRFTRCQAAVDKQDWDEVGKTLLSATEPERGKHTFAYYAALLFYKRGNVNAGDFERDAFKRWRPETDNSSSDVYVKALDEARNEAQQ